MTEKGISKLENWEISKFVGEVQWECGGRKIVRAAQAKTLAKYYDTQALGGSVTGKRISKLENWEISKFVGEVQWKCGGRKIVRAAQAKTLAKYYDTQALGEM